jgi:hypothetical protein
MTATPLRKAIATLESRSAQARSFIASLADPAQFSYAFLAKIDPWQDSVPINAASQTDPVTITAYAHPFKNGDVGVVSGVVGMTQLNGFGGTDLVVANATTDTFQLLGVDATGFSAYTGGGAFTRHLDVNWPDPPVDMTDADVARREIFAMKRISGADACHVIPRIVWTSGAIYSSTDYQNQTLPAQKFYAITPNGNLYKCLWNNSGGQSVVMPTSTSLHPFVTNDGYTWKYMLTLNAADDAKFGTPDWAPIRTLVADDASAQWLVQQAAIPGTIDAVIKIRSGQSYDSSTVATILGDGVGATLSISTIDGFGAGGAVLKVRVASVGRDYRKASVLLSHPSGIKALFKPLLSPPRGHGSDPISELFAFRVMIVTPFVGDESGSFLVDNPFRKIGILRSPKTLAGKAATANVYDCRVTMTLQSPVPAMSIGDRVTSGASFSGIIREPALNGYKLTDATGTLAPGDTVTNGTVSDTVVSATLPAIDASTGDLAYLEHRGPTTRRATRTDFLRTVIEF